MELGKFPTPLRKTRIRSQIIYVKDDSRTSDLYGGNKVRKLEFVLGKAHEEGARSVITYGGTASNHVIATALFSAKLGMETGAVLFKQHMGPGMEKKFAYISRICTEHPVTSHAPLIYFRAPGIKKKMIPPIFTVSPGASSIRGVVGYVNAGMEFAAQARDIGLERPYIFVATGTCGTAAGIYLGLALAGFDAALVPVVVSSRLIANKTVIRHKAKACLGFLADYGVPGPGQWPGLKVDYQHLGKGYGHPTPGAKEAVRSAAEVDLKLDTTYTGKALSALLDGEDERPKVFWNTYSASEPWIE